MNTSSIIVFCILGVLALVYCILKLITIIKDYKKKEAIAIASSDNLSLAIGKKGQNVKLASRLTHYKIEVKGLDEVNIEEYREKYSNTKPEDGIEEENVEKEEIVTNEPEENTMKVEDDHEESANA